MAQRNQSTVCRVAEAVYCALLDGHESVQVTQTVSLRRRCIRKVALRNTKGSGSFRRTGRSCFRLLEKCREIV